MKKVVWLLLSLAVVAVGVAFLLVHSSNKKALNQRMAELREIKAQKAAVKAAEKIEENGNEEENLDGKS